jgi:hypothetical protein
MAARPSQTATRSQRAATIGSGRQQDGHAGERIKQMVAAGNGGDGGDENIAAGGDVEFALVHSVFWSIPTPPGVITYEVALLRVNAQS